MAALAARRHLLLAVLLGLLSVVCHAADKPKQVEVDAYALVQVPGCNVGKPNSLVLPTGVLNECEVTMPKVVPDDPQTFAFVIPKGVEMTAMFSLSVQGGTASMSIWLPGSSVESPPDLVQNELFNSPASSEGWISLSGQMLAKHPGQYILTVSSFSGAPTVVLRVWTPPAVLQLARPEKSALAQMAQSCCHNVYNNSNSVFCSTIAPKALLDESESDWASDLCHIPPNSCNAAGQLTHLILPGVGLSCSSFPPQLGRLTELRRLDLSGNKLEGISINDVAAVLSGARELQELAIGSTGLTGSLSCDVAMPNLQVLDISMNNIEGRLPGCLVNGLSELYVTGNALGGPLPPFKPSNQLVTLYANQQRGLGFTGPIPSSISKARELRHVNLGGNKLDGAIPLLPASIRLFNVSDNMLGGKLGSLPTAVWDVDVSGNKLRGKLPNLARYVLLESFVGNNNNFTGEMPALPPHLAHLECVECGLSGSLPPLPPSLRRLDLSDNNLVGEIDGLDLTHMQVLRLANNSLTGGVPLSATTSSQLFLLDLHSNKLSGSLPDNWASTALQMMMLDDNRLTGPIPASLASLHNLGILRLGDNRLNGDLNAFAAMLKDPAELAAANNTNAVSRLFDFNVTNNGLVGPLPETLGWLGIFNPVITILVPGADGSAMVAPRVLDLSSNKFEGPWPAWLLKEVPEAASTCNCAMNVNLSGPDMHLACPKGNYNITDFSWQLASRLRYTCWDGKQQQQQQLLDYLVSPANGLDKIDTTMIARGDGPVDPAYMQAQQQKQKFWQSKSAVIAGAVVGAVVGVVLLGLLAWFVVGRRVMATRKAQSFQKFQDDHAAAAAASAGGATPSVGGAAASQGGAAPQ